MYVYHITCNIDIYIILLVGSIRCFSGHNSLESKSKGDVYTTELGSPDSNFEGW